MQESYAFLYQTEIQQGHQGPKTLPADNESLHLKNIFLEK